MQQAAYYNYKKKLKYVVNFKQVPLTEKNSLDISLKISTISQQTKML